MASLKLASVFAVDLNCPSSSLAVVIDICRRAVETAMLLAPHDEMGLVLTGTNSINTVHRNNNNNNDNDSNMDSNSNKNDTCCNHYISVPCALAAPTVDFLEVLKHIEEEQQQRQLEEEEEKEKEKHEVDFLETLRICLQVMRERTEKKRYERIIYLFTDAHIDVKEKSDINNILESFKQLDISLVVVGINFSDIHNNNNNTDDYEEKDNDTEDSNICSLEHLPVKQQNEKVLHIMCDAIGNDSVVVCLEEALQSVMKPNRRKIAQRSLLKVTLTVGDVRLATQFYTKTREERLPALKRTTAEGLEVGVRTLYLGLSEDNTTPSPPLLQQKDVIKGFRYGRTLIACGGITTSSSTETTTTTKEESLKLNGTRSLEALGFVPLKQVPPYVLMGGVNVITPLADDKIGAKGFRSIVQAMVALDQAMIVRFVRTRDANPVLGLCVASQSEKRDVLFFSPLPYAEEVRSFTFSNFEDVCCTDEEEKLIASLVEDMTVDKSVFRPRETFNPVLQQFNDMLRIKLRACVDKGRSEGKETAIEEEKEKEEEEEVSLLDHLRATSTVFGSSGNRLEELLSSVQSKLKTCSNTFVFEANENNNNNNNSKSIHSFEAVRKAFALKRKDEFHSHTNASDVVEDTSTQTPSTVAAAVVVGTSSSSSYTTDAAVKRMGGSVSSSVATVAADTSSFKDTIKSTVDSIHLHVTTVDPIGTFQQMLQSHDVIVVQRAVDELAEVIFKLLRHSVKDAQYTKCVNCVELLRQHCLATGEANYFNNFMLRLMLISYELGHKTFWTSVVLAERGIRLITRCECPKSTIENEAAAIAFISQDRSIPNPILEENCNDDVLEMIV
ncbi:putative KU80 protein [Trypanosoma theileri]|uniref:Putative KU80 protein n=1 Tax=Trypanosoma theileri TaxID=67003 RepID=A0A1X0P2Y5_9TRYP|nr:putative KU80 protein [Trypanosoma theileri]ORC91053.1 putative KU80 protein [Trypanosoma theileri]